MAENTKIEWTDATWNPIRRRVDGEFAGHGCVKVSPGCKNCYAERMQPRFGALARYAAQDMEAAELYLDEKELLAPLRWTKPRRVFVCSMSDLFWERIPDAWIDRIFAVMALAPQHVFQVLTKRSRRMREYFVGIKDEPLIEISLWRIADRIEEYRRTDSGKRRGLGPNGVGPLPIGEPGSQWWPLENVWIGVSVEDQIRADERIPDLLSTPAAVRFISAEPLLGPINLTDIYYDPEWTWGALNALAGIESGDPLAEALSQRDLSTDWKAKIDWVIVGGESGPGARPMHLDWARQIHDDCAAAGTPFFFKQWGRFCPIGPANQSADLPRQPGFNPAKAVMVSKDGNITHQGRVVTDNPNWAADTDAVMYDAGKKAAGRLLDGVEHNGMPEMAT